MNGSSYATPISCFASPPVFSEILKVCLIAFAAAAIAR